MIKYNIPAIETKYNGRIYRSKLEARWAATFDILGWNTEYEPCDFNGWFPDFVIHGEEDVFVEVKPIDRFDQETADKIDGSGCENECLLIGQEFPLFDACGFNGPGPSIGWLIQKDEEHPDRYYGWTTAALGIWVGSNGQGRSPNLNPERTIGFCHTEQSFHDRVTGLYDGGCYGEGDKYEGEVAKICRKAWIEAANAIQWKKECW